MYEMELDDKMLAFAVIQRPVLCDLRLSYSAYIEYDLRSIEPYLPRTAENILDIGSGLGGIDVRLAQLYPKANLYLVDGNGLDAYYGSCSYGVYNSLSLTKKFLMDNDVDEDRINIIPIGEEIGDKSFDLILSLFSWGFHYPLSTYYDMVREVSRPGTVLIVDVRGHEDSNFTRNFELIDAYRLFKSTRRVYRRK